MKLRTFAGIFSLFCITWILALMVSIKSLEVLWYLFFVITLLHGPTLLIIFVFNNRTRQLYIQKFGKLLNFSKTTNSTKYKDIKVSHSKENNSILNILVNSLSKIFHDKESFQQSINVNNFAFAKGCKQ